jgi:hypothetical protein
MWTSIGLTAAVAALGVTLLVTGGDGATETEATASCGPRGCGAELRIAF